MNRQITIRINNPKPSHARKNTLKFFSRLGSSIASASPPFDGSGTDGDQNKILYVLVRELEDSTRET